MKPGKFAAVIGFTEEEVKRICEAKNLDFEKMKAWYDGYTFGGQHSVYNPDSVMQATGSGKFRPYWKKTTAAETLMTYMEQDDLQNTIARLTAREQGCGGHGLLPE